jgi:hypothetical protein
MQMYIRSNLQSLNLHSLKKVCHTCHAINRSYVTHMHNYNKPHAYHCALCNLRLLSTTLYGILTHVLAAVSSVVAEGSSRATATSSAAAAGASSSSSPQQHEITINSVAGGIACSRHGAGLQVPCSTITAANMPLYVESA